MKKSKEKFSNLVFSIDIKKFEKNYFQFFSIDMKKSEKKIFLLH